MVPPGCAIRVVTIVRCSHGDAAGPLTCTAERGDDRRMSTEQNVTVVRRYFEEYHNGRRLDLLDDLVAEDLRAPTARAQAMVARAFPDYRIAIEHQLAEDDVVATVWSARGTHEGPWDSPAGTVEATGRSIEWTASTTLCIVDGWIAAVIGTHWDHLGILQQMGAVEAPDPRTGFLRTGA